MPQDVIKIMSDTFLELRKESACSNNTDVCCIFNVQLGRHGGDKGESGGAETRHKDWLCVGRFRSKKECVH